MYYLIVLSLTFDITFFLIFYYTVQHNPSLDDLGQVQGMSDDCSQISGCKNSTLDPDDRPEVYHNLFTLLTDSVTQHVVSARSLTGNTYYLSLQVFVW